MDDAEVEGRGRGVAAGYFGTGDHLHFRRGRAGSEDLTGARDIGALFEAVAGAEIGVRVVARHRDVVGAQARLPAVVPLCVSVPTVLLAPMIIVPPAPIRAVPVPLNPVVALIIPPAASSVPLLIIVPASVVLEPVWPVNVAPAKW